MLDRLDPAEVGELVGRAAARDARTRELWAAAGHPLPPPGGGFPLPGSDSGELLVHYGRSTFGDPATHEEMAVLESLGSFRRRFVQPSQVAITIVEVEAHLRRDFQLVQAGRRWEPGTYDPERFVPGDVTALRFHALDPNLRRALTVLDAGGHAAAVLSVEDRGDLLWHACRLVSLIRTVARAPAYFLPVTSAQAILASVPPDDELAREIRLPAPAVSVYFGADLEIPPEFLRWSDHLDSSRRESAQLLRRIDQAATGGMAGAWAEAEMVLGRSSVSRARGFPEADDAASDLTQAIRDLGGYLAGVTLLADDQGHLEDEVIWTVCSNPDPRAVGRLDEHDRMRGIIDGYLPASTLAPLARNLAAAICWGAWTPPASAPPLPEAGSREWRRKLGHGAAKKAERAGALAGVHVIDLGRMVAPSKRGEPAPGKLSRHSPRPHPRRGHWRRSRVGPRDGWHYEGRYIPGRMVSLHGGTPDPRQVIYKLPVPPGTPGAGPLDEEEP